MILPTTEWHLRPFEPKDRYPLTREIEKFTLPIALKVSFAAGSALLSLFEPVFTPAALTLTYFSLKTIQKKQALESIQRQLFALRKNIFDTYEIMSIIRKQNLSLTYATTHLEAKKQAKILLKDWNNFPLNISKSEVESTLQALADSKKSHFKPKKAAAQAALAHMCDRGHIQGPLAKSIEEFESKIIALQRTKGT